MKILKNSFGKEERLCSEKDIDTLYKTGQSFLCHPVVLYYLPKPGLKFNKVLVSVSKKKFKRAVDRNLLKRRLREAYRLNKSKLTEKYFLGLVYVSNDPTSYKTVENAVIAALQKLEQMPKTAPDRSDS